MGFPHIQEKEYRLGGWRSRQLVLNPCQLIAKAPGVTSEIKTFKWCREHGASLSGGIEPIHRAAANCAVALTSEAFNHICPLKAEALIAIITAMASEGHSEKFAGFRVEPGLTAAQHPRSKPIQKDAWLP